tara:strand:+ start:274 stop:540 length:267 start_codon:yes stop_codon:yes gene_type:complete
MSTRETFYRHGYQFDASADYEQCMASDMQPAQGWSIYVFNIKVTSKEEMIEQYGAEDTAEMLLDLETWILDTEFEYVCEYFGAEDLTL